MMLSLQIRCLAIKQILDIISIRAVGHCVLIESKEELCFLLYLLYDDLGNLEIMYNIMNRSVECE